MTRAFETGWNGQTSWKANGPNDLRPGKFLHALGATVHGLGGAPADLESAEDDRGANGGGSPIKKRLLDIQRDAYQALVRVAGLDS